MSEMKLDEKASAVTEFPVWTCIVTFLMGALFVFVAVFSFVRYGFDLYLLTSVPMGLLGVALCGSSVFLFWLDRRPLDENGIEVMRDFPFHKPSTEFLREVTSKRGTVRTIDLRWALKLHRQYEGSLKQSQVEQLRNEVQQRFSGQP